MNKNELKAQYEQLKPIYRFVTNKKVINIVLFSLLSLFFIGIIMLICFICAPSLKNSKEQEPLIIFGISFIALCYILFHLFQYLRTKASNYIFKEFNFDKLVQPYIKDIVIKSHPYNEYKSQIIDEHNNLAIRQDNDRVLTKNYFINSIESKKNFIIYSQMETNEIEKGHRFKSNHNHQVIIMEKNKFNLPRSLFVNQDKYDTLVFDYKKKIKKNNNYILTDAKDFIELEKIYKKYVGLNKIIPGWDLKIDDKFIYYENQMHQNFAGLLQHFKFFKSTWNEIFKEYEKDIELLSKILSFILMKNI